MAKWVQLICYIREVQQSNFVLCYTGSAVKSRPLSVRSYRQISPCLLQVLHSSQTSHCILELLQSNFLLYPIGSTVKSRSVSWKSYSEISLCILEVLQSNLSLYSGAPAVKSHPGERISALTFFSIFLIRSRKSMGCHHKLSH
jgi:hypothetical protein